MPSLITHALAAHNMIPKNCYVEKAISKNMYAFNIGSSGPDLFYFYHAFPWSKKEKKKEVYHYGELFHKTLTNEHFKAAIEFAKQTKDETVVSYVAGWIAHYALDRNAHPFIFHYTGNDSLAHRRMEAELDARMLDKKLNTSIKKYKPYELVNNDSHTIEAINKIYKHVLKEVYSITLDSEIVEESIKDMRLSYRLLHDPNNIKRKWINKLEKTPYELTGTMIPNHVDYTYDITNDKHNEWCNPSDNTITSTKDFYELFNDGVNDGILLLTLFNNYLNNSISIDVLLKQFNNRDYCTGLPNYPEMKYFNLVYKKI